MVKHVAEHDRASGITWQSIWHNGRIRGRHVAEYVAEHVAGRATERAEENV